MKRAVLLIILLAVLAAVALMPAWQDSAPGAERVVLLHGLGRSRAAMFVLENRLAVQGYEVHNLEYDSMQLSPREIIAQVAAEVVACCTSGAGPVHFVGHSLGGLVIRGILADDTPP